jgi:hypothetical protein
MNIIHNIAIAIIGVIMLAGCAQEGQESKDAAIADRQQAQYAKGQPIPAYDFSLERHLLIQLYDARNMRAATHSVWRSITGVIEDDCPSMGFGIPYDTSLTNPLKGSVFRPAGTTGDYKVLTVEQAEPNGIFASKNTSATWVMCTGPGGVIEPHYVETKVTAYPYPITVDYENNRVKRNGESSVKISAKQ